MAGLRNVGCSFQANVQNDFHVFVRETNSLRQNLLVDLRIQPLIEFTFVIHSTVMLGEFHTKDYRRNEEKQAVADGEPKTVLQSQK